MRLIEGQAENPRHTRQIETGAGAEPAPVGRVAVAGVGVAWVELRTDKTAAICVD